MAVAAEKIAHSFAALDLSAEFVVEGFHEKEKHPHKASEELSWLVAIHLFEKR